MGDVAESAVELSAVVSPAPEMSVPVAGLGIGARCRSHFDLPCTLNYHSRHTLRHFARWSRAFVDAESDVETIQAFQP